MIKYTWFSSGLKREDLSPSVSVNQVCFVSLGANIQCNEKDCVECVFKSCARYSKKSCFQRSFTCHHFHYPLNTENIFTNDRSEKMLYWPLCHKLRTTCVKKQGTRKILNM